VVIDTLDLNATGTLDLNSNDMILSHLGIDGGNGSLLHDVGLAIGSARAGGAWTGVGLTSTSARLRSQHNTTLGLMSGSNYTSLGNSTFNGRSYAAADVLVRHKRGATCVNCF